MLIVVLGGVALGRISRIDYAAPVLEIQKRVGALHRFHIIANLCAGLPWWFLWIAIFVLEVKANLGVDLFVTAPEFVWISVAIGSIGLFASVWFYRRSRDPRHPAAAQAWKVLPRRAACAMRGTPWKKSPVSSALPDATISLHRDGEMDIMAPLSRRGALHFRDAKSGSAGFRVP